MWEELLRRMLCEPNPNDDEDGERYCILCVPRSKVVCDDEVEVHIDSKLKPV